MCKKKKPQSMYLSDNLIAEIDIIAKKEDRSRSYIIGVLLEKSVRKIKNKDNEE